MSKQIDHNDPMVTKNGVFDMQVCVPEGWSDDEVDSWANKENPSGTEGGWHMKHTGDESLSGCDERVKCEGRTGFIHIMFQC